MRKWSTLLSVLLCTLAASGQPSDFVVLKKKNNRTIKTYATGSFLSAVTSSGFTINGYITGIRNDSIYVAQEETRLVGTEFGSTLDTLRYSVGVYYRDIKRFNYTGAHEWGGRRKSFSGTFFPTVLIIGGVGFIVLEMVNTAYRKESLTQDNKPLSLGIAAGVAVLGVLWKNKVNGKESSGSGRFKVIYVHGEEAFKK